jgi:hypothetical protein
LVLAAAVKFTAVIRFTVNGFKLGAYSDNGMVAPEHVAVK